MDRVNGKKTWKATDFQNLPAICGYILFYLLIFIRFPFKQALPGNCDTWLAIALSNSMSNALLSWVGLHPATTAMYPARNIFAYGEASPGCAAIFIFFKTLGFNDIIAYYFYIVTLFSLTAYGLYLLAWVYTKNRWAAFYCGFAFTCSNFAFANIDDSIVIFYLLPALCIYFLKNYISENTPKLLLIAAVLGGFQIYFSAYVFCFQSVILGVLALMNGRNLFARETITTTIKAVFIYLVIPLPFFLFYAYSYTHLAVDPWPPFSIIANIDAIHPDNLFHVLPNNLIYDPPPMDSMFYWALIRRCAFLGSCLYFLALLGLRHFDRQKAELVLILILGLGMSIAVGDYMHGHSLPITLSKVFPWISFLRVPLRAFFMCSFALSILGAFGVVSLFAFFRLEQKKVMFIFMAVILCIHFIENKPKELESFSAALYHRAPNAYLEYFENKPSAVVLDLPSVIDISFKNSSKDLFEYNREAIYMNWQTQHHLNIVGGVNGYFPKTRMIVEKCIKRLPESDSIAELREMGIEYLVFHKTMVLQGEEGWLAALRKSNFILEEVFDNEQMTIFKIR
jgi:hypothetical protein